MPTIRRVLEAAIRAPSGDNAQPWRFVVEKRGESFVVEVWLDPDADTSLYNYGNHAAYFALGACVENICTAAPTEHLDAVVETFPDPKEDRLVARVILAPASNKAHARAQAISTRVTNRHPYSTEALPESTLAAIKTAAASSKTEIHITTSSEDAKSIGHIGATNEYVVLGDEKLHRFLFEHINWSKQEDERKRTGFSVESLALPPPARIGFKIASSWKRCALLNRLVRFNVLVASQNALLYQQAAAFGCITTTDETPGAAFSAGRAFEACWLEAQAQGLSVQPLMGTLFLRFAAQSKDRGGLSEDACRHVLKSVSRLQRVFGYEKRVPYVLFRLGRSTKAAAYTQRRSVDDVTEWKVS